MGELNHTIVMIAAVGLLLWIDYKIQERRDVNRMHKDLARFLEDHRD